MATATEITARVNELALQWEPRKAEVIKWYRLIQGFNDLHQPGMESVISSDPRTGFNMARWLLMPRKSAFVVNPEGLTDLESQSVGGIERYADKQLALSNRRTRTTLFGKFLRRTIGLMLSTGWYAVASMPTQHGWHVEAMNPIQVYPEYGVDGNLVELGRRYTLSGSEFFAMAQRAGWKVDPNSVKLKTYQVNNLWRVTRQGIEHGVAVNNVLVKDMEVTPFSRIPIETAPVGGLPDDGTIMGGDRWKAEVGNSVIASVAGISKNHDRLMTFIMQVARDTANPKWLELTNSGGRILEPPEKIFERGAVFSGNVGESAQPIQTPTMPPELQFLNFSLRSMQQRGLFSDIAMGNVTQEVSGFLMSSIVASSQQSLEPFQGGLQDSLGSIASTNIDHMRRWQWSMDGEAFPDLPDGVSLDYKYDISIPGDFIQRASSARVLNPTFRLSVETLIAELFPEVPSSTVERGRLQAEDAMDHPVVKNMITIKELGDAAAEAREMEDLERAQLFDQAADIVQSQLQAVVEPPQGAARIDGVRPEAMPTDIQQVLGMGG